MPTVLWALLVPLAPQAPLTQTTFVRAPRAERAVSATSAGTIVLERADLERTGERSLPRAIARAGGVFVQETNLGGGAPILRGLVGNQVLILVDGVRLNDSTTREGPNQSLSSIDPATVERVEIVRGPASVLYGSDALGGTILITTRDRAPASRAADTPLGEGGMQGVLDGSYDSALRGYRASAELSNAGVDDGLLGVYSRHDWNDLTTGGGATVEHTGFDGGGLFGSWVHALGAQRTLRLALSRTRDLDVPRTDRLNTGFGQTAPADEEWAYSLQDRERALLVYDDREAGVLADSMQVRLSLRRYTEERTRRSPGSDTRRLESDVTETVGLGADWRRALGDSQLLTWGLDVDHDDVDSLRNDVDLPSGSVTPKGGAFAPGSSYLSTGLFVQDELTAWDPLFVTLGLRYSYYAFDFTDEGTGADVDGDFDALTASLQVARDLSDSTRVGASVSQGFRAPNLADLAKDGDFASGVELANPALDPEQSWTAELALDHVQPTWSAGLALFYSEIHDAIGRRLIDAGGPSAGDEVYGRANVGELRYVGSELSAEHSLGGAESAWSVRGMAEVLWGRQFDGVLDPSTGTQPYYDVPARRVPPLHGLLALRYEEPLGGPRGLWAELGLIWALEQDQLNPDDASDPRIDPSGSAGWATLDLDVGGPLARPGPGSSWHLGVHNLLDERYRVHGSGFDAPGVSLVAGLRLAI